MKAAAIEEKLRNAECNCGHFIPVSDHYGFCLRCRHHQKIGSELCSKEKEGRFVCLGFTEDQVKSIKKSREKKSKVLSTSLHRELEPMEHSLLDESDISIPAHPPKEKEPTLQETLLMRNQISATGLFPWNNNVTIYQGRTA